MVIIDYKNTCFVVVWELYPQVFKREELLENIFQVELHNIFLKSFFRVYRANISNDARSNNWYIVLFSLSSINFFCFKGRVWIFYRMSIVWRYFLLQGPFSSSCEGLHSRFFLPRKNDLGSFWPLRTFRIFCRNLIIFERQIKYI